MLVKSRCERIFSLLVSCSLVVSAVAAQPAPPADTVWIAEADGALRIAAVDGTPLVEISDLRQVRAAAVDLLADSVWLLAGGDLYRYDFLGECQLEVRLGAPDTPHADLAVHPTRGDVWAAVGNELWHVDSALDTGPSLAFTASIRALAYELGSDTLWVATDRSLETLGPDSEVPIPVVQLPPDARVRDLALDSVGGRVWLALDDEIRIYALDSTEVAALPLEDIEHLATTRAGAWAATKKTLTRLSADGTVSASLEPFGQQGKIIALAVTWQGEVWTADQNQLARVTEDGAVGQRLTFRPPSRIWDLEHAADVFPPAVEILEPEEASCTAENEPTFRLSWSDAGAGVEPASLVAELDGSTLEAYWQTDEAGASLSLEEALADGPHHLVISISDRVGNTSPTAEASWTIDTVAPSFSELDPSDGLRTHEPTVIVSGRVDEPSTVELFFGDGGSSLTVAADGRFLTPDLALVEGPNHLRLEARDCAGNSTEISLTIDLDTVPPPPIDAGRVTATLDGAAVAVVGQAGAAEPGTTIAVIDVTNGDRSESTAAADGSFSVQISGAAGDLLELVSTDRAGNSSSPVTVTAASGGSGDLPPDPAAVATPVDPRVATDIAETTEFLYSGTDPIQRDVAPGAIEPSRVAVLRGRVLDRGGAPLPGARIEVHERPGLGWTLSRADGAYDFAVNGGGQVILDFRQDGRLPAQRHVDTPWRDWVAVDDVVLVKLDPNAAVIASGSASPQVARGSRESDADGERQATVLFPAGVTAAMTFPDGTSAPLSSFTVRATEYTVGAAGPRAMPAELPAASGYTYAVELSADEAIAAGATSVVFDRPLPLYVENFLGFPVGGIVPIGYYDRQQALWVPTPNGRVVKVLGISGGMAELDVDGSGTAAAPEALAELGIDADELVSLAELYVPGTSLWRAPVPHFTPWDCNWPFGPPLDAQDPPDPLGDEELTDSEDDDASEEEDPDCTAGSIIECQNQTLRERLALPGVPFDLYYSSARVRGRQVARKATIRLTGPDPSPSLKRVELQLSVAGQHHEWSFGREADRSFDFLWDGRDGYGRRVVGSVNLYVLVRHVYPATYLEPADFEASFASLSESTNIVANRASELGEVYLERRQIRQLTAPGLGDVGLWTFGLHHRVDPNDGRVDLGYGESSAANTEIRLIAGHPGVSAHGGDGGPASEATFAQLTGLAVVADGSVYLSDQRAHRVRRIAPDGTIATVAGNGVQGSSGDGGPATEASLDTPQALAIGPDGSLYVLCLRVIRKVDPSGVISTLETIPEFNGFPNLPRSIVVGPDGLLYVGTSASQIWRYEADHRWTWTAGAGIGTDTCGTFSCPDDGGPALQAKILASDMAFDAAGNLYVSTFNSRIRKITPDGIVTTVVGGGSGVGKDGGPATGVRVGTLDVAVSRSGELVFSEIPIKSEIYYRIRKVAADDNLYTIVGGGTKVLDEGWNPREIRLLLTSDFVFAPDGKILLIERNSVWSIRGGEFFAVEGRSIASEDGSEIYVFDRRGRHLETRSALTGEVVLTMEYDAQGALAGIVDAKQNRTVIERSPEGDALAVVGPFGSRISVDVDELGFLRRVTFPSGATHRFEYSESGLLEEVVDPLGNTTTYRHSAGGRLLSVTDAVEATKTFAREAGGDDYQVTQTTAGGRQILYEVKNAPGGKQVRVRPHADGTRTEAVRGADESIEETRPDGTTVEVRSGPHPRFGMQSPILSVKVHTPQRGLTLDVSTSAQVEFPDPTSPSSFVETETTLVNNKPYQTRYDSATRTVESTTPEGRTASAVLDEQARVVLLQLPELPPERYEYDEHGRVARVRIDAGGEERVWELTYDEDGRLSEAVDPLGRRRSYAYDADGRLNTQTLEDDSAVAFDYDDAGRLTGLTPPGRSRHGFSYTPVSLPDGYAPPSVPGTQSPGFEYDGERRLTLSTLGDGSQVAFHYDGAGRLESIERPDIDLVLSYGSVSGQLTSVSRTDGSTLSFSYDGFLPTATTWSGAVSGTVSRSYDNDYRVTVLTVGGDRVLQSYDYDGLLVHVGELTLSRSAASGFLVGTSLGNVSTTLTRDDFGALARNSASFGTSPLYDVSFQRDRLGRIARKTETVDGVATTWDYTYDPAGRLEAVEKNGAPYAAYTYDANGNRLSATEPWGTATATYDEQDRLLAYGAATYSYNGRGQLTGKIVGQWTTTYERDVAGNLRRVDLPNGQVVEYLVDPADRRIGKKVDGTLVQGFLYQDQINPIVELDGAGNVVSRFVYGTQPHVPDYLVKNGRSYRYFTDQIGSVRLVVDTVDGSIAQRLEYDTFGRVVFDSNPGFQPFGFGGGLMDRHTGLVRLGARDYDPETGRWTSKDPIGFAGGDTNLYGYVVNDPVNLFDPLGTDWIDDSLQGLSDFSAGFGDTLTFGLTGKIRQWMGVDYVVNRCSGFYTAGEVAGVAHSIALGAAGGLRAAGTRAAGREFSHWIPDRLLRGGPAWLREGFGRSRLNGNYVNPARHYLHDRFRYPSGWRDLGPRLNPVLRQLDRVPRALAGTGAGAAYGGASATLNKPQCGCR